MGLRGTLLRIASSHPRSARHIRQFRKVSSAKISRRCSNGEGRRLIVARVRRVNPNTGNAACPLQGMSLLAQNRLFLQRDSFPVPKRTNASAPATRDKSLSNIQIYHPVADDHYASVLDRQFVQLIRNETGPMARFNKGVCRALHATHPQRAIDDEPKVGGHAQRHFVSWNVHFVEYPQIQVCRSSGTQTGRLNRARRQLLTSSAPSHNATSSFGGVSDGATPNLL
jgi:hypothetical protein